MTGRCVPLSFMMVAMVVGLAGGTGCSDDDNQGQMKFCEPPTPPAEALRRMGPYDGDDAGPLDRILPGNRLMTPAGQEVEVGGFPVDVRVHPTLPLAYITNTGYSLRAVQVVDLGSATVVQEIDRAEAFFGMALSADASRLYLAGGASGRVDRYDVGADGRLTAAGHLDVEGYPAGLAMSEDGSSIYVAQFTDDALAEVDLATGQVVNTADIGKGAYGVALVPQGGTAGEVWITAFDSDSVVVVDLATFSAVDTIELDGSNPLGILASPDGAAVYVTVADGDEVVKIDRASRQITASQAVGETSIADDEGDPLPASNPSGLTADFAANRIYVARGADNAVGIFEADSLAPVGAIPVAWYPTAVALSDGGDTLVVTNAKGVGTGPNALGQGGKNLMTGTVSIVDLSTADLPSLTAEVEANVRRPNTVWQWTCDDAYPVPATAGGQTPIEHIVLIVRENKTYDTLLSDLDQGERDPELLEWGENVTPNLHALARQFANHDNFYDDSECSVQGHLWLTGSFVNEYMERIWLEDYRGNGFSEESAMPEGQPDFGNWFLHLMEYGVDFTNYGEVVGAFDACCGDSVMNHTDIDFPGSFFNLDVKDEEKALYVADQIQKGILAPFTFLLLPNDHTKGTSSGAYTPASMISDNDYGTGIVVDALSHSEFWDSTAVFIVQDDPQSTADHIDYHRSICLVVSPWAKHGHVSSVHTSFPSLFRTFELILGLPPMNRYDALATPFWDAFTNVPDFTPFTALPRNIPDELNEVGAPGQAYSDRMDFRGPDRNPELPVILWWVSHGAPPPGSRIARELAGEIPSRLDAIPGDEDEGVAQGDGDEDEDFREARREEREDQRERDHYDRAVQQFYRWLRDHPNVSADLRPGPRAPDHFLPQRW